MDIAWGSFVGNLASQAITKALSSVVDLGRTAINTAIQMENLQTQFTTLTGSAEIASKVLKDLIEFSASTPFQLPGLSEATKQLIQAKVPQEELIETLRKIGDIAAVTGRSIENLAVPFARLKQRGSLTIEELNKFEDAGAGLITKMAELNGVSINQLRKDISAGKVPFQELEKAIDSVTSKGGQFADGMLKQSETLSGKLSTLSDNWNILLGNLASSNSGTLKDTVDLLIRMVRAFDNLNKATLSSVQKEIADINKELKENRDIAQTDNVAWNFLINKGKEFTGITSKLTEEERKALETRKESLLQKEKELKLEEKKKYYEELTGNSEGVKVGGDEGSPEVEAEIKVSDKLRALRLQRLEELNQIESAKIEFLQEKINELAEIRTESAENELEFQELVAQRDLEILIQKNKKKKKEEDKAKKDKEIKDKAQLKLDNDTAKAKIDLASNTAQLINSIAGKQTREGFLLAQGAATASVILSGMQASAAAQAPPPLGLGPVAGEGLAGLITANTAVKVATIAAQTIGGLSKLENGGILNSGGTSLTGDNNLARFNDREMFLNMRQQSTLFNAIDTGSIGGNSLNNELLAELVDIQRSQNTQISINGRILNKELQEDRSRRL